MLCTKSNEIEVVKIVFFEVVPTSMLSSQPDRECFCFKGLFISTNTYTTGANFFSMKSFSSSKEGMLCNFVGG